MSVCDYENILHNNNILIKNNFVYIYIVMILFYLLNMIY